MLLQSATRSNSFPESGAHVRTSPATTVAPASVTVGTQLLTCFRDHVGCEIDTDDGNRRIGVEESPRIDAGAAPHVERVRRVQAGDDFVQERLDERRGRERDLGDRSRVLLQVEPPLTRPTLQQRREMRVRPTLVFEHRPVVGGEEGVALGDCARSAAVRLPAIAASPELADLHADVEPRAQPVGSRAARARAQSWASVAGRASSRPSAVSAIDARNSERTTDRLSLIASRRAAPCFPRVVAIAPRS